MKRRGFIGALIGLTAGAVAVKSPSTTATQSNAPFRPEPMRLRQVLVEAKYVPLSPEGEKVMMFFLKNNASHVRQLLKG